MFKLSLLSRGHGKLVQNKQKLEVYFEPEVSLTAGRGHILGVGVECSILSLEDEPGVFWCVLLLRW